MEVCNSARPRLTEQHFEIAVIGGGINGVAIARECARAGRSVLLLEQNDFASGTTSRATRIIHGGLRYLEHGEIGLVRESLQERERLLRERPHLVHPQQFVLALPKQIFGMRSALGIRLALWLYKRAAGRRTLDPKRATKNLRALEASLDHGLRLQLFSYEDAQCEYPERLVAEWLCEAAQAGATVRNYTKVVAIEVQEGRARALRLRDEYTGDESFIRCDWVINAAGPWVDCVLRNSSLASRRLIGGVRGSHLLLPKFAGAPESALYTEAYDGRPIFLVPWAGQYLFGTTEVREAPDDDPSNAHATGSEMRYLFSSFKRLFPHCGIGWEDIRGSYSGVRPLPYSAKESLGGITRRHILHDHLEDGVAGLISVVGGKLTTAAALARQCARKLGLRVPEPPLGQIAVGPSDGFFNTCQQWATQVGKIAGISRDSAAALAEWHGRAALGVARLAARDELLREKLCPHTNHIVAEAVSAVLNEHALTLGDILLRRVPVALGACWSEQCTAHAAHVIGKALGWNSRVAEHAAEEFELERTAFIRPVSRSAATADLPALERLQRTA